MIGKCEVVRRLAQAVIPPVQGESPPTSCPNAITEGERRGRDVPPTVQRPTVDPRSPHPWREMEKSVCILVFPQSYPQCLILKALVKLS